MQNLSEEKVPIIEKKDVHRKKSEKNQGHPIKCSNESLLNRK